MICLKGVILLINIHKTSRNNKLVMSIFDKAHFQQESIFEERRLNNIKGAKDRPSVIV